MDIYEITGYATGVSQAGVNYLQPQDAFQNIVNGFIYRQVLQSRQGIGYFAPRLSGETRVFGIFEHQLPNSSKELLVFDQNFLYKYNEGTGVFDLIPFGGSMAAYAGFNISAKDLYISGTSYPTATNTARFVFCGDGISTNASGSAIFFYDGSTVQDYTNVADNPNYALPTQGALTKATYVVWFNERLNFIVPTIASVSYQQGVLYSGIRNASGNGDKFNVAGSGLFQVDNYQNITGVTILGQVLSLNLDRSAYTLEKTRDAFNPYFGRGVPGVVGTNAKFSAVAYYDTVRSIGKTGILGQDGRQNLRVDNKIPYFTSQEMDQLDFNLTYGGFDRLNNQFLWSYKSGDTDTDTQDSVLVSNYEENTWSVFTQRFSVFGQTDIGRSLSWDDIDETTGNESWAQWDTTEEIWDRIGLESEVQKTLAGDDLGFVYQLNRTFDDYFTNISAATNGSTTTLTVSDTAIQAGDLVTISGVVGMLDADGNSGINNYDEEADDPNFEPYVVISATTTSIEINLDSSLLTAYTSGGSVSKIIEFSAETIPFNPYRPQGKRCYVSSVEFLIECNGGSVKVDVFADEQETPFKRNVVLKPDSIAQRSQWMSMSVNQESEFLTFVMKQSSPGVQLRITSMRIQCAPGGKTSG